MPRQSVPRGPRTVEQAAEDVYRSMPAEEVRCRGGHHRFARDTVLPGQPWPESVRAWPDDQGRVRIEDPCVDCGLCWRVIKSLPGGELDAFARPAIVYDPDWVRVPQGLDRRKRTIRQEGYRRGHKKDQASIQQALNRTSRRGHVPQTTFRHAGAS
jgi:hypothetical protein